MIPRDKEKGNIIYRTPQFERCLEDLHREKGGAAALAARKLDEFISCLLSGGDDNARKKFSYTSNGEYRIKNCKKIDLVAAYRLVLIQKDNLFVLVYVGSHDDCFRWIERNKGLTYEIEPSANVIRMSSELPKQADALPPDVMEERRFVEKYEEEFMKRLNENTLLKIFPGWCKGSGDSKTA